MIEKALQVCNAFCDSIFRLIEMLDSSSALRVLVGSNSITRRLSKIAFMRDSNDELIKAIGTQKVFNVSVYLELQIAQMDTN